MLARYQLDRAHRNLSGYTLLSSPPALGVRTLRGSLSGHALRGLGAAVPISAADAFQQALSMYSGQHVNPRDSGNSPWVADQVAEVQNGQFDVSASVPGCSGQAPNLNLFSTASGLALGTTSAGVGVLAATHVIAASAVPVIGWAIAGVGAIIGLIGAIFQHHAAAVQRDTNFSCGALPAVNNAFQVIAQAVSTGQMKPADAAAALPEIYSQFMKAGGASGSISGPSGIPGGGTALNNSPYCNSNCEFSITLLGMVLFWQGQYQAMADQAAAPAAPASQAAAVPSTQIPNQSAPVAVVSSGSKLVIPPVQTAASSSGSEWLVVGLAAIAGLIAAEVF